VVLDNHPGILLDIGCAAGEFLATVHALNGRPVMGVDLNELAVRRAWQRFGVPVWVGSVPGLPLPDASIDVVTMWHVFEHLPYPLLALYDVARILREDGILVIACPMSDSWEARLFRRYWAGYDVPRHLFTYSRQTLPQMLRRAGFESFEVPGVVWGFNSAKISSAFWLQDIFPFFRYFPRLLRSIATLMGAGAALLFWVLSLIFCNHAAVAVFVARKRIDVEV
jgi:SAM-dependent methyltransferase